MPPDPLFEQALRLLQADQQGPLWRHQAQGWLLWPLVRRAIYESAIPTVSNQPSASRWNFSYHRWPLHTGRRWFLLYESLLQSDAQGHPVDPFWGSVPFRSRNGQVIVGANSNRMPPSTLPSTATIQTLAAMTARLARWMGVHPACQALARDLHDMWPELRLSGRDIQSLWVRHMMTGHWWYHRLARGRPRQVIVHDPEEFALVWAARRLGIPVVEVQHGLISRWHPSYAWGHVPAQVVHRLLLPDRLLTWGDGWSELLADHPWWTNRVDTIGHPFAGSRQRPPDPFLAVYTAGGSDGPSTSAWLTAFLENIPPESPGRLEIRPHPRYQNDVAELQRALASHPRVRFLTPSLESIEETLDRASLHLSIGSTCHYLATSRGCPTIILPGMGHRTADPLRDDGSALQLAPHEAARLFLSPSIRDPTTRWMKRCTTDAVIAYLDAFQDAEKSFVPP